MAMMTRRLHMGCGETLQSHLPASFRKLVTATEARQQQLANKQTRLTKKGRYWK